MAEEEKDSGVQTPKNLASAALSCAIAHYEVEVKDLEKSYKRIVSSKRRAPKPCDIELAATVVMIDVACSSGPVPHKAVPLIHRCLHRMFTRQNASTPNLIQYAQSVVGSFKRADEYADRLAAQIPSDKRSLLLETLEEIVRQCQGDDPMVIFGLKRYRELLRLEPKASSWAAS